jgi:hypothetical protein
MIYIVQRYSNSWLACYHGNATVKPGSDYVSHYDILAVRRRAAA